MSKLMMRSFLAASMLMAVPAAAMADDAQAPPPGSQPAYQGALPAGGAMHDRAVVAWWATPGVAIGAGVAGAAILVLLLTNNGSNGSTSTSGTGN